MTSQRRRLPAEWEPQDGVLLAWPHARTDWAPILKEVEPVFVEIAKAISRRERALIVTGGDRRRVRRLLVNAGARMDRVRLFDIETNDTWARDFGPVTVFDGRRPILLDYFFNGWGLKFSADLDNLITARLHAMGAFGQTPLKIPGIVLEGGSIESDGRGTLMTTSRCLLSANRNPHLSKSAIERHLKAWLGARRVLWLDHGFLQGDDTDSHIDTLARFAPDNTIVHVSCDDRMRRELERCRSAAGRPYRLLPLPMPRAIYDRNNNRLPATYANFLVINGAVLLPLYSDAADGRALEILGRAFPGREIIGIPCRPLIKEHGSLHCVTMQIPKGVWRE